MYLRGLCVLAVVLLHINLRLHFEKSSLGSAIPKPLYPRLIFWSGHDAVKIFFVVSGFLITSTILARWGALPQIDLKAFYRLRAARIAPLLLAILAILSILHLSGAKAARDQSEARFLASRAVRGTHLSCQLA